MKPATGFLWGFVVLGFSCALCAQSIDLAAESRRGSELLKARRYEEAIPLYSALLKAQPENPSFAMNLGLALHLVGSERKAIEQFKAVLRIEPSNVPAQLFLGEAYLTLGEPAKAIQPLESAIQAQPGNPDAREMIAEAFFSLQRIEEAADQFRTLTELVPENPRAWDGLRRTYEVLARVALEQLKRVAPESPQWLALVAQSHLVNQQYEMAFSLYRQALAKMPTLRGAHTALAEVYRGTGHPDWAAIEEMKEREIPPLDCFELDRSRSTPGGSLTETAVRAPAGRNDGEQELECHFWAGRYQQVVALAKGIKTVESHYWLALSYNALSLQTFSRLTEMKPSPQLHQVVAKIYLDRKEYVKSAMEWQKALNSSPGDPRIQKGLAVALTLSRDLPKAQAILEDLLNREPDSAELSYLLGDTLLSSLQTEEAIGYLRKAVDLDPNLLPAHKALARAYLQVGKSDLAIPHLNAALPVDDDGSLYYQLAQAYRKTGQIRLERE
ncbi:MAG: tetratricopeptide repeat protein, partial [Acidobacteria bacterium]|nr:tetratricopeptide repeat protein [Acidobacteriota bacterium]